MPIFSRSPHGRYEAPNFRHTSRCSVASEGILQAILDTICAP
jgi:hypothetical protein